jgi:serine/threonine protein kinase
VQPSHAGRLWAGARSGKQPADAWRGHPLYMAAEVLSGEAYDSKADVWSCAVVFFGLLVGDVSISGSPFYDSAKPSKVLTNVLTCDPFWERLPDVHPDLLVLLRDMLQRDPNLRPTAAHVAARLMLLADARC